jgi:predicted nucleic acid-binding protein
MIVADTNLIAYLLINGPYTAAAEAAFNRDDAWIAPPVWRHELLNVLATSVREKFLAMSQAQQIWTKSFSFVEEVPVEPLAVLELAAQSRFATFDCYYIVLARQLGTRVVTADKRLLATFKDAAVSIQDFAAGA